MRKPRFKKLAFVLFALHLLCLATSALAVDIESFEFGDFNFTELDSAANTANPGNFWSTDINVLTDSFVDTGEYVIKKFNDDFAPNYLQIDDVNSSTSGSRYIVVEVAGWDIRGFDAANAEQVRFAFLNDNSGTSGSSVTAQMQIARNTTTEAIELVGDAVGVGSTDLSTTATLSTTQTNPFTMVLELDKTSNTYEVFYKDGSNPSQSLGIGTLGEGRDGNSIRFAINNNFGSDLSEFFSIDRIALTDTNPLTDLLTLEVDRSTGTMKLVNSTGAPITGLESYSITSSVGALDSGGWKPITDNYDNSAGPGDGSVDSDDNWSIDSTTTSTLSESVDSGDGGTLGIGQEVDLSLSLSDGPWVQNPTEDIEMELMFAGGVVRRANVNFVGNGGEQLALGDMNFDGSITAGDWLIFFAGAETDLSGISEAQAYQAGDLNNDGVNDIFDFGIFKDAYEAENGSGSFALMLANIPEPSSLLLFGTGTLALILRRRKPATSQVPSKHHQNYRLNEETSMNQITSQLFAIATLVLLSANSAFAGISEDFTFDDVNGTLLESATNNILAGDDWNEDTADMSGSSIQNGVYRIQKDNEGFGTNYLDTTNFSSGKAWLVAEMAGWSFTPTLGAGEDPEEIRFAFLNNDTGNQGGSTITGQAVIQRNASDGIELVGKLTTSGTDFGPVALSQSQSDPFTVVLEIDEDSENYSVYYKNNTDPFVLLGTAPHVAGRDGNSVRLVANNSFSGAGEFFDIDRIYVTDVDPINITQDLLTLQIDLTTGNAAILNDTSTVFDIDSYRIESSTDDLVFSNWNSFSDQEIDLTDGPDGGSTAGDGTGESWDEAPGSDDGVLAESFLLGSSVFTNGRSELLGSVFDVSGDTNSLEFQYRLTDTGAVVTGNIEFITSDADFDGDSDIDGADFLTWARGFGSTGETDNSNGDADGDGTVGATDLAAFQAQFGTTPSLFAATSVPEPTTCVLVLLSLGLLPRRLTK